MTNFLSSLIHGWYNYWNIFIAFIVLSYYYLREILLDFLFHLFIYFGCTASTAAWKRSLVAVSRGCSSLWCAGSHCSGISAAEQQACWPQRVQNTGSAAALNRLQRLWHMGLAAPWHVECSWTRGQTCGPYIGRWIFIQCTTREGLGLFVCFFFSSFLLGFSEVLFSQFRNIYCMVFKSWRLSCSPRTSHFET